MIDLSKCSDHTLIHIIPYIHPYNLAFFSVHNSRWRYLLKIFSQFNIDYKGMCFWHFRRVYFIKHRITGKLKKVTFNFDPYLFSLWTPGSRCKKFHHLMKKRQFIFS
jgi:hypothetical protein